MNHLFANNFEQIERKYLNPIKNPIFYCGITKNGYFVLLLQRRLHILRFLEEKKQKPLKFWNKVLAAPSIVKSEKQP